MNMEEKVKYHFFSSLLTFFMCFCVCAAYTEPLKSQTLILRNLPNPPTLSWPESTTLGSDSEPDPDTISVNVHHIDALSLNKTPPNSSTLGSNGTPLDLDSPGCSRKSSNCQYQVSYGDGSFTFGDFSMETLTFRRAQVPRVALGCGHDNEGLFVGAAGLLGLGRGGLSFPTQAGTRFNNKFSYCLTDRTASAKPSSIVFGDSAVSRTARFTPIINNPKLDTFYYLELLGISVGGAPVRGISASLFRLDSTGNGGVIIDSGTSVTRLTRPAYVALRDAFRVGASHLKRAPEFSLFDTCYDLSGISEVKVPTVVMHFRGADVSFPAANYLIPVDNSGRFCFAFAGTMSGLSIIGNIQQQGFRVVFDLAGSRVGFAPRGCA
ncbi:hypothetical protein ACSQ67_021392 [Phaseolus vulgaris]